MDYKTLYTCFKSGYLNRAGLGRLLSLDNTLKSGDRDHVPLTGLERIQIFINKEYARKINTDNVGAVLYELRFLNNMTQRQVSEITGLATFTIHNAENGLRVPTTRTLLTLLDVYGSDLFIGMNHKGVTGDKQ